MGVYGAFLKNGFLTQMAHRGTICHADACKDYGLVYGNDYGADPFGTVRTDRGLEPGRNPSSLCL